MKKITMLIIILLLIKHQNCYGQKNNAYNGVWKVKYLYFYEHISMSDEKNKEYYKKEGLKCEKSFIEIQEKVILIMPKNVCFFDSDTICDNFAINEDTIRVDQVNIQSKNELYIYVFSFISNLINENKLIHDYIINNNIESFFLNIIDCDISWGDDKMFILRIKDILVIYCGSYFLVLNR
jgi:hypothetical protein